MSVVADVIKSFDKTDELSQVQKEAVEALAALGDSKAEVFKMQIHESLLSAGDGTNMTVPVTSIVKNISSVRAFSSSESGNIGKVVKDILNSFIKGTSESIVDGIGTLISETLSVFLGTASASTGTTEEYYVTTEGLSIIRVDMKAWYLNVSASSILQKMQRVVAVVGIKSVVDLKRLDFSTFLNLYQQQLIAAGLDAKNLKAALTEAKLIYKEFGEVNKLQATVPIKIHTPPAASHIEKRTTNKRKPGKK